MPTIPIALSAVPPFPTISDRSTYNSRAYAWAVHMSVTFAPELLALANVTKNNADEAHADALAAAADKAQTGLDRNAAATSATASAGSASAAATSATASADSADASAASAAASLGSSIAAATSATASAGSAAASEGSRLLAVAAAQSAVQTAGVDLWVLGSDYLIGRSVYSPGDFQTYRCILNTTSSDLLPELDPIHWVRLSTDITQSNFDNLKRQVKTLRLSSIVGI